MNATVLKALVALVPAGMLFSGSLALFMKKKAVHSVLQLLGAACLLLVVLTHVAEGAHLFPWMNWGREHSVGHYLDLGSAVLAGTLFPLGYLLHAVGERRA
jgi:hypothetical protein